MNIIVVGCGKIGKSILSTLIAEGHDVTCVDNSPLIIDKITNMYDAIAVCGNGADCETLSEAGVEKAELLVAVTGSDELNMLCCFVARKMGAKHTIARIRNPEYNDKSLGFMRQQLNLSMSLNPEQLSAQALYHLLKLPAAVKVEPFSRRNFELIEIKLHPDSPLDGMSLIELRKKAEYNFLICVVQRGEDVFIPDGNFVLKSGDKIGISASPSEIVRLLKSFSLLKKQARNIMILGASRTAYYLSKMLLSGGNSVKVIEVNQNRCERFLSELSGVTVINGDGANQELLIEEGIESVDAFVALTGMDEENILVSYFANQNNVPTVISKINRSEFISMSESLGLECVITPNKITADVVLRYARALENSLDSSVETLYKIMDDKAEALEFAIRDDCPIIGIPLKEIKIKNNTIIAGIIRGRKTIIPGGDDIINAGDNVVIITSGYRADSITDVLK